MKCHQSISGPLTLTEMCAAASDTFASWNAAKLPLGFHIFLRGGVRVHLKQMMWAAYNANTVNAWPHFMPIFMAVSIQDCIYLLVTNEEQIRSGILFFLKEEKFGICLIAAQWDLYIWQLFILLHTLCGSWMIKLIFLSSSTRQCKCSDNRIAGHYSNECSIQTEGSIKVQVPVMTCGSSIITVKIYDKFWFVFSAPGLCNSEVTRCTPDS